MISTRTLTVPSGPIHVYERGSGPLVLLLHGFPEVGYSWRRQLGPLADAGYHAVAPDLPGYGRSYVPEDTSGYCITRIVDALADLVAALGAQDAIVVGHDWGAPIAWTCAWTRPDVFRAVMAVGNPFGGRGIFALPGNTLGQRRPSEVGREIAGDDLVWYAEYFQQPGVAEREFDEDPRGFLTDVYYGFSGTRGLDHGTPPPDLTFFDRHPEAIVPLLRTTGLCLRPGERLRDRCETPKRLPEWLTAEDLDHYVAEFEQSGMGGAYGYYRALDLDWELLAPFVGTPVRIPAFFVGADRDAPTMWAREAIADLPVQVPQLRGIRILNDCGHWIAQEKAEEFTPILLDFVAGLD